MTSVLNTSGIRPDIRFVVQASAVDAHLFDVQLHIARPTAQLLLSLPVWIPGSYLVREFSKNLQGLRAVQNDQPVAVQQLSKNQWKIACNADSACIVSYQVCAYDTSVRTAWLDRRRGFFNGTSLCLRVHGLEEHPHALELLGSAATEGWQVATGLKPAQVDANGFGLYQAAHYDELVDCPVEMGRFWRGSFEAGGVPHEFVVAGAAPSFDGERLLADTKKICEAEIAFWHADGSRPPMDRYVFMLNVVDDNYGGLEHRNSTALICGRRDLPRKGEARAGEGYNTLLGLISHEYFHTWNVKRLRPAELARYDYEQENYTELLWFFEGFTSYYDDLFLRRAGLLDNSQYLKLLARTINQVLQTPGRLVQSVAEASFDAWVKYYRQDENTANHTVSYYTKGSLVALCLDLALRANGTGSLDEVMRSLWHQSAGGPISEADVLAVVGEVGSPDIAAQLRTWVHSTGELPLRELLEQHGVKSKTEPAQLAQKLGLRVQENHSVQIKTVLRGGAAEQAGMMAADEWLAVDVNDQCWRISKLDDVSLYAAGADRLTAWVARDQQILQLTLKLDGLLAKTASEDADSASPTHNLGLEISDKGAAERWLTGIAA
ncbi:MAG: peptidase M61 [Comamonas sp.]|jgi:predicted metalloprotease with PDZ domain|uniref:M61 family metallopeptidase n=1 Tax=Comamonas sp. TaxID=34028 RepID=UPI0012BFB55C|nr:peptidase M61 [Comamonas sp.]MDR3065739.1 peptidase M61 [Comamonas sp.]MPS92634.1 M61 family peptidase [Comamonas sp.]